MITKIRINEIKVNPAIAIREGTDEETIQRYTDTLEKLPPVVVFRTDDKYLLADGFHRWAAATRRSWEYIEAEVREGSYEEATEFAITANLRHGKPLTSKEYELALKRLRFLHPDWLQRELGKVLFRSRSWVESVLAADRVEKVVPGTELDTRTKSLISRAPEPLWGDISRAAQDQRWTSDETHEKVQRIKMDTHRVHEVLYPVPRVARLMEEELREKFGIPEAPADKLVPLSKEINKLIDLFDPLNKEIDKFCEMLDPSLYDWGTGALASHLLQGLYVLADKIKKLPVLADKVKGMIEFLEARQRGGK